MEHADALLGFYVRQVIAAMGDGSTTTDELADAGRAMFGPSFFRGVYTRGEQPEHTRGRYCYIVNTRPAPEPGHWMLVAVAPGRRPVLFDSFARRPGARWQPQLRHMALTSPDVDQDYDSEVCGQLCLAAAAVYLTRGLEVFRACA